MPIVIDMKEDLQEKIELTEGLTTSFDNNILKIKGNEGEVERKFNDPKIKLEIKGREIILSANKATKREKKLLKTCVAHIKNLVKGVQEKFVYNLKICSSHFPMNVSLNGNKFIIKNFLGEKCPRSLIVKEGVEVKINGDVIEVKACDKEKAGLIASNIELLTKKTGKDVRIFQDGIYITQKGGKQIS